MSSHYVVEQEQETGRIKIFLIEGDNKIIVGDYDYRALAYMNLVPPLTKERLQVVDFEVIQNE